MSRDQGEGKGRDHLGQPYHAQREGVFGELVHHVAYQRYLHVQGEDKRKAHQQVIPEMGISQCPVLKQEFYGEAQTGCVLQANLR